MKKHLFSLILLLVSYVGFSQKGLSYQAVILDPSKIEIPGQDISGQPLVNGDVWMKFSIYNGSTLQFEEVQKTKTDAYGLVNLMIGSVSSASFNSLTWDGVQKSMQVFVSFNQGASYTKVSDQKLNYNPYALYAETAGKLGSVLSIAGGGTGATTAADARVNLGLGNVDNTSDAAKPISTATKAALDLKANVVDVNAGLALKANESDVNSGLALKANSTDVTAALALKANTTDMTAALAAKADTGTIKTFVVTQVAAATIADADASTKGKIQLAGDLAGTADVPTVPGLALKANTADVTSALALKANTADVTTALASKANTTSISRVGISGLYSDLINKPTIPAAYTLPVASGSTLGGVKIGANLSIDANGVLSAAASSNSASTLTGVVPVANGGTGATTVAGARAVLGLNTTNVAIGDQSGQLNQGMGGVGVGAGAGANNQASGGISIGYVAGYNNQGASSVAIGPNAAQSGQGSRAVAIGFAAGQNGQGDNSVAIGSFAGNVQVANSIAINATGMSTPLNPTNAGFYVDPIRNVSTSMSLFYNATTKEITYGTAASSGAINLASGVTGTLPIANGGTGSTTKNFVDLSTTQTIGGSKAFSSDLNIFGITAGRGNSGVSYNTVFGLAALNSNTTGNYNDAFGSQALAANLDGYYNSAFGQTALFRNTSGSDNSGFGINALNANTSGSSNTAMGSNSLVNSTTGSGNSALGMSALSANTTGSNNTGLGYQTNVSANNLTNATAIGYGAIVSASNTIQLGNANVTDVKTSATITAASINSPIYASTPQALTDGSTVVWNPVLGLNASVTLGGNRNLAFLYTPTVGSYGTLVVTQDGTGNRTLNLPSVANKVLGSSSTTTIALSTAAGAKDIVNFYYDGTNYFWNVGQGYGIASSSSSTANLATGVTGTLSVANGGTGATTLTGLVKGSGTSALSAAVAGTDYLAPNGSAASLTNFPTFNQNTTGTAANVTGVVSVANGGTGVTTSTGSGNVVLSASPNFTGTPTAPTATSGTNNTQLATTEFVTSALSSSGLPSQSGNSGKFLTTNGTTASWASSSGGVPYSGASGAVNLGNYNLTVYGIKLGTAGTDNTALQSNLVLGRDVLVNNTNGTGNMAIGNSALYTNVGGYSNIGIGNESQYKNVWGWSNTSIGQASLYKNETGNYNTAVGTQAGYFLTSSGNTAVGYNALDGQGDGGGNTGVGYNAGGVSWDNRTYNSTFLGYNAKSQNGLDNVTVIGYNAYTNEHHTIQLGDTRIVKLKTSGTIWSNGSQLTSDIRLKTNIKPLPNSIDLIMKLNPVSYNKKNSIESKDYNKTENGFIAQELQKVIPYIVKEGADNDKILSVDYNSIIPVLTKGIQEQQLLINAQQKQIDEMNLILDKLMKEKK